MDHAVDDASMRRAIELAQRGEGFVEPNPMVGCVLVRDGKIIGEGWHQYYGGDHAEIVAIRSAEGTTAGTNCYVTLEPCAHFGKTPPCTDALIAAGVRRVVAAMKDPHPEVAGKGFDRLNRAGITVEYGLFENEARRLCAPYLTCLEKHRPWIIAKWAMTLDGKIATRTGSSRWISSSASRNLVHGLRGRMDAILIGSGTAVADDPMLTVRLKNPEAHARRVPLRIVLDSSASLPLSAQLVRTAREVPLLLGVGPEAPSERLAMLEKAGCEIFRFDNRIPVKHTDPEAVSFAYRQRLNALFGELLRRKVTNLLVEGGSRLFGTLFDLRLVDEAHIFIAPKLCGGGAAPSPIGGFGLPEMQQALRLRDPEITTVEQDIYVHGRVEDESAPAGRIPT